MFFLCKIILTKEVSKLKVEWERGKGRGKVESHGISVSSKHLKHTI